MKISLDHHEKVLSEHGGVIYDIKFSLQTTDTDLYVRLLEAIKKAIPDPEEMEEKQSALGFHMDDEEGDEEVVDKTPRRPK